MDAAVEAAVEVDPKVLAVAKALIAKREAQLDKIRENVAKYAHAIVDSLEFDEVARKFKVRIRCVTTGDETRWVYTSDLHQVQHCKAVADQLKAERLTSKKGERKEALKLAREMLLSKKS
jgi:hypothetical protein